MTTLAAKLAQAVLDVGGKLAADKRNLEQKYDYISADKILSIGGQALAAQGIVIVPAVIASNVEAVTYTKTYQGREEVKSRYDASVTFAMTVTDGESSLEFPWIGVGNDYAVPDKAAYKAITSGHKYFVAKLLMIGVGNEDGEHDQVDTAASTPAQAQRQQAPPPPAKVNGNGRGVTPSDGIRKALHARGGEIFGEEWEAARHWMLGVWTAKHTPAFQRHSATELTDEEMATIVSDMNQYADALLRRWQTYQAAAAVTVADSPELAP